METQARRRLLEKLLKFGTAEKNQFWASLATNGWSDE